MQRMAELAALIEEFTGVDGRHDTAIPGLSLNRRSARTGPTYGVQNASFFLIAQGSKRVRLQGEMYLYDAAHYLVGSIDIPVIWDVLDATLQKPYLSLSMKLDFAQIASLLLDAPPPKTVNDELSDRGLFVSPVEDELLGAVIRLVRLQRQPHDISVLAPLICREIFYRLLQGKQSRLLHQLAVEGSQTYRIARAIEWLKVNFAQSVKVEELAREANMSASGLHAWFKAVTAMSPLQFQKQLRLQEARRMLLAGAIDAATASYRVGYESPSQFSREYSRLFGAPPLRDMERLRRVS